MISNVYVYSFSRDFDSFNVGYLRIAYSKLDCEVTLCIVLLV